MTARGGHRMDSELTNQAKLRLQILEQINDAKGHTRYITVFSLPVAAQWDKNSITGHLQILHHEGRVDLKMDPAGQAGMVKLTALGLKSLEQPETADRGVTDPHRQQQGSPS